MRPFVRRCALVVLIAALPVCALADKKADQKKKNDKAVQAPAPQETPVDLSQPLSLDNAIKIGLKNQNTLGIAESQLDAARARVTSSKSSYYPQISPSYSYSSQLTSQTFNGVQQTGTVEQGITQIAARQLIFDMGKREENVLASKYAAKGSEFNVYDARQSVIVNVTTSYYDLLRRKELVKVAESSVARADTELKATVAFVEAGTSPKKDILQAEADLGNAKVQLIVARNDVRLAMTTLKNAMGVLTALPVVTPDTPLDPPSAEPDTRTTADYIQQAYNTRTDLKRDAAFIDSDRHSVKIANINAGFQVQADITEGYRIDPSPGENRSFGTTFSYPLFDGGAARANVRQAKASLEQARRQLELTKQGVQLDVETAFLTREEARQRVTAAQAALKAAQQNYDAAREAQKEGAGTIIDVITAQTLLVTAETNAVQAVYDFYTSDARLRRAVGNNDPFIAGGKKP